jgi:metallophosphoesterase (TIGR00282 family)
LNLLFIGDVVGNPGRRALRSRLPSLRKELAVDACIVNGENAAAGLGINASIAREFYQDGVDCITLGNHTWSRHELLSSIESDARMIRPANGSAAWPGRGFAFLDVGGVPVMVINVLGRISMEPANDPFAAVDALLEGERKRRDCRVTVIDFHAEATSEKAAMAHFVDGRVSLVVGTHTHVQTADERILERGTAFLTDVGMTGPVGGIIGMDREISMRRLVERLPAPFEVAKGPARIEAVLVQVDPSTGKALSIRRVQESE